MDCRIITIVRQQRNNTGISKYHRTIRRRALWNLWAEAALAGIMLIFIVSIVRVAVNAG